MGNRTHAAPAAAEGKQLCGARKTNGKGDCTRPAGWGTDHPGIGRCKWHGGCTPNHKKAVQRELATRAVETYGLPREIEPHEALLEEIHRTAGHVSWLELQVRQHDPESLVWGTTKSIEHGVTEEAAKPSVWVELYQTERRHLVAVCKAAIAAGIAERQVKLAEQQGALIAQVIRGVLEDLGVADNPDVPKIVRRRLLEAA